MDLKQKILNKSGCPIHYWVSDNESSEWIIFLHGAGCDHRMFAEQIKVMTDKYKILVWDARGHGMSRPIGEEFTLKILLDDLIAIMDREGCSNATFIGQSMGGNVSQEAAFYYPERVKKLVLIDCTCNTSGLTTMEKLQVQAAPFLFSLYPWKLMMEQSAALCGITSQTRNYVKEVFGMLGKKDFAKIFIETTKSLHYEPNYKINKPMLLLCGDKDMTGNIKKIAPRWAKEEKYCKFFLIENAGHNSNQDNPELVNRLILDFLRNE